MSVNLYVHFEREIRGVNPHERDHVYAASVGKLDRYAERRGLVPLGSFVSYSGDELENLVDDDRDDDGSVDLDAETEWFDAHDVHHAVEKLVASVVDEPPTFVEQDGHTAELLGDLNNIAMLARRAAEAGVRVRLSVGE